MKNILPTPKPDTNALKEFFTSQKAIVERKRQAAELARPALARLIDVCRGRTHQSFHVRALLYSLWNGQDTSLLEIAALDYAVREDVCLVILAFGYEPIRPTTDQPFFYEAIKTAFVTAGLFDWFIEAHNSEQ